MQIVEENLSNAVESPTLSSDDNSRDEYVSEDEAEIILDRFDRFDYASRDHIVITLLWATGLRTCSIRSLDLDDGILTRSCWSCATGQRVELPSRISMRRRDWWRLNRRLRLSSTITLSIHEWISAMSLIGIR